jgi:hypothetical protein
MTGLDFEMIHGIIVKIECEIKCCHDFVEAILIVNKDWRMGGFRP